MPQAILIKKEEDECNERLRFICPEEGCNKSFTRKPDLARHARIHDGIRPFACKRPGCNATFNQPNALKIHQNIHTGAKPYRCKAPGCTSRFGDPSSLNRHTHECHGPQRVYKCFFPDCTSRMKRSDQFRNHLLRMHQKDAQKDGLNIEAYRFDVPPEEVRPARGRYLTMIKPLFVDKEKKKKQISLQGQMTWDGEEDVDTKPMLGQYSYGGDCQPGSFEAEILLPSIYPELLSQCSLFPPPLVAPGSSPYSDTQELPQLSYSFHESSSSPAPEDYSQYGPTDWPESVSSKKMTEYYHSPIPPQLMPPRVGGPCYDPHCFTEQHLLKGGPALLWHGSDPSWDQGTSGSESGFHHLEDGLSTFKMEQYEPEVTASFCY